MVASAKCLLLALVAGVMFNSGVVMAQGAPAAPAPCTAGVPPADVGAALKGIGRMGLDEWQRLLSDLRKVNGLVARVALIQRWEKDLPKGIRDQVQEMIDASIRLTLQSKPAEATVKLEEIDRRLKELTTRVDRIDNRVDALEGDKSTRDSAERRMRDNIDKAEKKAEQAIDLAREATQTSSVVNLAPVLFAGLSGQPFMQGGLRLSFATKNQWYVSTSAVAGTTGSSFAWSTSVDLLKRKSRVQIGLAGFADVVDDIRVPGVTSFVAGGGLRGFLSLGRLDIGATIGGGKMFDVEGSHWVPHVDVFFAWRLF